MSGRRPPAVALPVQLVLGDDLARRLDGTPLLVLLDVDGTLAPIAPRPEDARVPERTRAAIARLVARPGVHVALVSGRAAADARRMVDVAGVWAVGNHGFETVTPDGVATVDARAAGFAPRLRRAAHALEVAAHRVSGARLEDKQWTLTLHYRLVDAAAVPALRDAALREGERNGLVVTEGKAVVELRPPVRVDKGTATTALLQQLGGDQARGSVLFAGDDTTDEDAFLALRAAQPRAVTVRVGPVAAGGTQAEFTVGTTGDVQAILEWLAHVRT